MATKKEMNLAILQSLGWVVFVFPYEEYKERKRRYSYYPTEEDFEKAVKQNYKRDIFLQLGDDLILLNTRGGIFKREPSKKRIGEFDFMYNAKLNKQMKEIKKNLGHNKRRKG
jgi:hypothetical protein